MAERIPTLYVSEELPTENIAATLRAAGLPIRARRLDLQARRRVSPAIYLIDGGSRDELSFLERLNGQNAAIVVGTLNGSHSPDATLKSVVGTVPSADPDVLAMVLRIALENMELRSRLDEAQRQTIVRRRELADLNEIGVALSSERSLDRLYHLILDKARALTGADGASLYLLEDADGHRRLRFKLAQTLSTSAELVDRVMPLSKASIAGYVALTGHSVRTENAYAISSRAPYSFNQSFDKQSGYRTRSMLTVPMTTARGEVVGVVQLINRKRQPSRPLKGKGAIAAEVMPFSRDDEALVQSFASQAAVALDNRRLIRDIRNQFEGFVQASVTAIESRDPTTSGHSSRVAVLTVALAEEISAIGTGRFSEIDFGAEELRAIRYAALLHDFGKVGVREQVLVKAKKLYPWDSTLIQTRFFAARQAISAAAYRRQLQMVQRGAHADALQKIQREVETELAALDRLLQMVWMANEPTLLDEGAVVGVADAASHSFVDVEGNQHALLQPHEVTMLQTRRGTLTATERIEIQSHVEHTFRFLSMIPWTKDLQRVPEIAGRHHERLNGTGYPDGLPADDIPIESRMMAVADIYDALTAHDRPYKKAVRPEQALDLLRIEAGAGFIDAELLDVFISRQVYNRTRPGPEV